MKEEREGSPSVKTQLHFYCEKVHALKLIYKHSSSNLYEGKILWYDHIE